MKLIDKDALVAEIERRNKKLVHAMSKFFYASNYNEWKSVAKEYRNLISYINTLEVKEADLEDAKKEELAQKYIDYTFKRHNIDPYSKEGQLIYYAYMHGMNQCLTQLRAQKGE